MGKPYNLLDEQDKKNILKLYYKDENKHLNICDIAIKNGYSIRSFRRVLKEYKINTNIKNKYTLNHNYFENIDNEHKAYWLGFLYADGYVGDSRTNNIIIGLSSKDIEHLYKFKKDISYTGEIRIVKKCGGYSNGKLGAIINFSSKKMASDLRKIGLYPNKSTTMKNLPEISKYLIHHFIRGYFDGDGSISVHKFLRNDCKNAIYRYRVYFSIIGTKSFIEELKLIIPGDLSLVKSHSDNMIYLTTHSLCKMNDIYNFLYKNSNISLERKLTKWLIIIGALDKKLSKEKRDELLEAAIDKR